VFERVKTVHSSDRPATMVDPVFIRRWEIQIFLYMTFLCVWVCLHGVTLSLVRRMDGVYGQRPATAVNQASGTETGMSKQSGVEK
jgi:hypothetical protein